MPNLQPCEPIDFSLKEKRVDLRFRTDTVIPLRCTELLDSTSMLRLFREFIVYYVIEFKYEFQCVTLRGSEECGAITIPKFSWSFPKRWRFCIEDPFERVDTSRPRDLGSTISTHSRQIEILTALENAMHVLEGASCADDSSVPSAQEKLYELFL